MRYFPILQKLFESDTVWFFPASALALSLALLIFCLKNRRET